MTSGMRGSISGLVVCLVVSMMAVVGLSVEGGRVVKTYGELASLAGSAARLGGQQVVGIQDGQIRIDKPQATATMADFLKLHHTGGEVTIGTTSVKVTLRRTVHLPFLRIVGVGSRTVTVSRSVVLVKG
jgi:hypothetical protein